MRLKYYLRGLGIGIAVTAVLMSVAAKGKGNMTDAQIIARAKELGMVDGVLTEISGTEEEITDDGGQTAEPESALSETEEAIPDAEKADENPEERPQPETDTGEPDGQTGGQADTEAPAGSGGMSEGQSRPGPESSSTVIVAIYPGEGSFAVSRKLAALGLVESADIYDGFLCQNGYDKKLCTGNYEIKEGATAEEIARIITRSQ